MENKNVLKKLFNVQQILNIPKNQHNENGNFNFRSAEDILNILKPVLNEQKCVITLSDEPVNKGDRYYIVSTATIIDTETGEEFSCTSSAREGFSKRDLDESQITGASTSYARKYALGGLLAIDKGQDADVLNESPDYNSPAPVNSLEEAFAVKVSLGFNKDRTLKEVYESVLAEKRASALFWIANHDPLAKEAAKFIISSDESLIALCK